MISHTTKPDSSQPTAEMAVIISTTGSIRSRRGEARARAHDFIEELIRGELDTVLACRFRKLNLR